MSFDDDLTDFLRSTEQGARKILKTAMQKEKDAAIRERARQKRDDIEQRNVLMDVSNKRRPSDSFALTGPNNPPNKKLMGPATPGESASNMTAAETAVLTYSALPQHA
jgi:hypothetical protein